MRFCALVFSLKLSVGVIGNADFLDSIYPRIATRSDFRLSMGEDFEMDSCDWSNRIRYHIFYTRPDTECHPMTWQAISVSPYSEGPCS